MRNAQAELQPRFEQAVPAAQGQQAAVAPQGEFRPGLPFGILPEQQALFPGDEGEQQEMMFLFHGVIQRHLTRAVPDFYMKGMGRVRGLGRKGFQNAATAGMLHFRSGEAHRAAMGTKIALENFSCFLPEAGFPADRSGAAPPPPPPEGGPVPAGRGRVSTWKRCGRVSIKSPPAQRSAHISPRRSQRIAQERKLLQYRLIFVPGIFWRFHGK